MASKWTVSPETVKIDLEFRDEKFWVTVKKWLTVGEVKSSLMSGMKAVGGIGEAKPGIEREMSVQIDWKRQAFGRAEMYLVAWSLSDDSGIPLKLTREVIESLHEEVFELIDKAIDAHVAARAEEKKALSGPQLPRATSD